MRVILISLLFCILISSQAQQKKYTEYSTDELIKACDLKMKMPRGFREIPAEQSDVHLYQYAIKDSTVAFEVRYYIRPYDLFTEKGDTLFYPDKMSYSFFVTSILDVSGFILPSIPRIDFFDKDLIKFDCNADYGIMSFFQPIQKFGGYKYCIAVLLKKSRVGEVTMFLLYNEQNREAEIIIDSVMGSVDFK